MIKDSLHPQGKDAPVGFRWSHTEGNRYLTPTRFPLEITDFHDMTAKMIALVLGLENAVQPSWRFQSVLTNNTDTIATIYTNPLRSRLTVDIPPIADFIRPQFLSEHRFAGGLNKEWLEPYLAETDFVPIAHAYYNDITIEKRTGLLRRKHPHAVYQSGVAYIRVGLLTRDENINLILEMIAFGEATEHPPTVQGSRRDLDKAKAQRPYSPRKLFK